MSTYVDKPISLIEKKKQQWAKEREELAGLGITAPWSSPPKDSTQSITFDRSFQIRNPARYVSKFAMANPEIFRKDLTMTTTSLSTPRRSSLPPLYKNQYNSIDRDMERGGETSGYGSDNPHQMIQDHASNTIPHHYHHPQQQPQQTFWNHQQQSGYESSSSYKDDRPKWRDKTNGTNNNTGRFWNGKENEPPNWVKRGLQTDEEIVVSNTSPAESPQQCDLLETDNRPYTSQSSINKTTHIRGQNCPMDSAEMAERERRRQIALTHQEAIRQQLEEREQRRRAEKERRIKEEQEEEVRIEREQEIERQRKEQEVRQVREKQEREQKRKEALQEALELAEKTAKLEKTKLRMMKQNTHNNDNSNNEKKTEPEDVLPAAQIENNLKNNNLEENQTDKDESKKYEKTINNLGQRNNLVVSPRPEGIINNLEMKGKTLNNNAPKVENESSNIRNPPAFQILSTPRTENNVIVLQTPSIEHLQNMQYAVLMQSIAGSSPRGIPIAIPVTVSDNRMENRVLTPTQYRNKNKILCDCSTQTDFGDFPSSSQLITDTTADESCGTNHKYLKDSNNRRSKERRARSEDRNVERPKWGANRPPTRYMKQSEKDPVYQRRKLRQKMRDSKSYDYKNSSDESQAGSPRTYRKRAVWRKSDRFFARNIRMYQTEIVPLELDKERIYYRNKCECCCRCSCSADKPDVLKIDHGNVGGDSVVVRDGGDRLPDCNAQSANYILDKLTSLHNSLLLKQEQWERSPRTPSLSSSTRNTENN